MQAAQDSTPPASLPRLLAEPRQEAVGGPLRISDILGCRTGHLPGPERTLRGDEAGYAVPPEVPRWRGLRRTHAVRIVSEADAAQERIRVPEGHTLHRLALDLGEAFMGTRPSVSSPQGRMASAAALLDGTELMATSAHGKHLFLDFEAERVVHIHLGLIGKFQLGPMRPPVGQVRFRLADERVAADLRGPQLCTLRTPAEVTAQLARLGPDPLRTDADPDRAWQRIRRSNQPIAALLMDQSVLSGVGNVYRAEVLFRNRLNPTTPGKDLREASWRAIWADLVELMPIGVRDNRIDTVRPEHSPDTMGRPPRVDDHGGEVYVYRRHDQPCWVCGSRIRTTVLAGRNLFWCGRCQRRR